MVKSLSTRERIKLLRKQGRIIWSPLATRASVLVGVVASLMWLGSDLIVPDDSVGVLSRFEVDWPTMWGKSAKRLIVLMCGTSFIAMLCGAGSVILQSGAAVRGRFIVVRRRELRRLSPVRAVLSMLLIAGLSVALVRWAIPLVFIVFRQGDYARMFSKFHELKLQIVKLVIVAGVVLAILSAMAHRFLFLARHGKGTTSGSDS